MIYEKPELLMLNAASAAVRGVGSNDNPIGDGNTGDQKLSTLHEAPGQDTASTSSTASAYEADE